MAREVISIINVWCDNTGRHPHDRVAATTSAALAYDGQLVRLDLCSECRDEMTSVLGEYAEFGESTSLARGAKIDTAWTAIEDNDAGSAPPEAESAKASAATRPRPRVRRPHQSASTTEVRAWLGDHADDHGLPVPARGARLSAQHKAAYDRGHGWDEIDGTWRPTDPSPTAPTDSDNADSTDDERDRD
ncbi:hypothetical protein [Frankia sp. AgB32]|uniref:hypothetical protein n=1 Tax=Frankia sp. AgB32 TaxID=631119 RepID=UPI00200DBBC5|nr:hypothetical protein [Frankia sp. AgB32]MCK9894418.1 hypothetical protein [Frankia sp. AgB32]